MRVQSNITKHPRTTVGKPGDGSKGHSPRLVFVRSVYWYDLIHSGPEVEQAVPYRPYVMIRGASWRETGYSDIPYTVIFHIQ